MVDRYFTVDPKDFKGHHVLLRPDNDILPLLRHINAFKLYADAEKVIVKVRLSEQTAEAVFDMVDTDDPFNIDSVSALGIINRYVGNKFEDIFVKYPELDVMIKSVDEDGNTTEALLIADTVIL